jgi:CHAD domain-containing protein
MQDDDGASHEIVQEIENRDAPTYGPLPTELAEMVRGTVRDRRVEPVATVRTARIERRLLDIDGRALARIHDDIVDGQRFTTGSVELSHWRQLTVELIDGRRDLLDRVTASLDTIGEVTAGDSTLHRALGWTPAPVIDLRGEDRDASAAAVIRVRLRGEVGALVDQDWAVRCGRAGAVTDMRLAALRLRCDLATWRPYLDEARIESIRRELRWLAGVLGRRRDADMLDARLTGTIRALPADMVVGPVLQRIERELAERRTIASERLSATLDGGRYFALLDALETLAGRPPFTDRADGPADELLLARLTHALERVERTLGALDGAASADLRADRLHELRKAVRRARYAAEAVEPRFGRRAEGLARQMAELQDLLGEHHDSVVARKALHEIGAIAHHAGESAFTYGILHGVERDRGDEAERAFDAARRSLEDQSASWPGSMSFTEVYRKGR